MINELVQRLIEERNVTLTLTINVNVNAVVTADELVNKVIEALKGESSPIHTTYRNEDVEYPKEDSYPKEDITPPLNTDAVSTLSTPVVIASQKCLEEVEESEESPILDGEVYVIEETIQPEVSDDNEVCVIEDVDKQHNPKGTYTKIRGEKYLKYVIRGEMIECTNSAKKMMVRLDDVRRLSKLTGDIDVEVKKLFYKAPQQNILKKLIKAIKDRRLVLPKEYGVTANIEVKPPIKKKEATETTIPETKSNGFDWNNVKPIKIHTLPALTYREHNGKIQLEQNGNVCHCNWEKINTFAMLYGKQLEDQIRLTFPTKECQMMITMFVKEVKQNHVTDPDAQYRPYVNNTTKPNEESGKIELEIPI